MTASTTRPFHRAKSIGRIAIVALVSSTMAVTALPTAAMAATASYTNTTPVAIPDAEGGDCSVNISDGVATSTITVPDAVPVSNLRVNLNISHTWQSDIIVDLTSPAGTTIRLIDRVLSTTPCGSGEDHILATLSDAAAVSIENYAAAGGTYSPMQAFSTFAGEGAGGDWVLTVRDVSTVDSGTLNSWSLDILSTSDFAVADTTAAEGDGTAVFTVTRSGATSDEESVDYATVDGTATAGTDYTATSGTLTFAPGATTATVAVPILDDTVHEADETFTLELSNPIGVPTPTLSVAEATATIVDTDPQPELAIADAAAEEDDGTVSLTVTRTGSTGGSDSVEFATVDGTATAGEDYVATSGTLTFDPGATSATITVALIDDAEREDAETFAVVLADPASTTGPAPAISSGTATVTIAANDAPRPGPGPSGESTDEPTDDEPAPPVAPETTKAPATELVATGSESPLPLLAAALLLGAAALLCMTWRRNRRTV